MEELLASPGWVSFSKLVDDRRRVMTREIIEGDSVGMDGAIETEKNRAYLAGMQLASQLPRLHLMDLKDEAKEIADRLQTLEDEDYEQTS